MSRQENPFMSRCSVIKGLLGLSIALDGACCTTLNAPVGKTAPTLVASLRVGSALLIYTGHYQIVNTVAWSPDGKRIVSGTDSKE